MVRSIPIIDFADYTSGDAERRHNFVQAVGDSLKDIGFFALENHGIPLELIHQSYDQCDAFFGLPGEPKMKYARREISHQRGYTAFGVDMLKITLQSERILADWKNAQTGRKGSYPANVWPEEVVPKFKPIVDELYNQMESLSCDLLLHAVCIWARIVIGWSR